MIEIIKGEASHSGVLAGIGKASFLEAHRESASKEDMDKHIQEFYSVPFFEKELRNAQNHYFILYHTSEIVGYAKLILDKSKDEIQSKQVTKLERLYLVKTSYGKGLGAKLFEHLITFSKKNNQQGIWLYVWKDNDRAIRFYHKKGFQIVGYYEYPISTQHKVPNHVMYLEY